MFYGKVPSISIKDVLAAYFDDMKHRKINMAVIGANSGAIKDFFLDYVLKENINCVLVEPIQSIFEELKLSYRYAPNLHFENSAIDVKVGKKTMYRIKKTVELPEWSFGLGSFHKNVILSHKNQINDINHHVTSETVNCITLEVLINKYELEPLNLLQIDTEGHDYEIVSNIDFKKYEPDILIFEYLHISFYQFYTLAELLRKNNYAVHVNKDSMDAIAINNVIIT